MYKIFNSVGIIQTYGSQVLPMFDTCMEDMYTAWRVAICMVW